MSKTATNAENGRRSVKPLSGLLPYLKRYKRIVGAALFFLALAATATLALPLAVRRMVDHGFNGADAGLINNYFIMLMVIAAVLALSSAMRYYFVMLLGERVVTDLRNDVFAHVMTLSPQFYDKSQSGEIVSRLTNDAAQIRSAAGATASMALRNIILCIGAIVMMVYTSPGLSGMVLAAIPVIVFSLVAFGRSVRRRSRAAQDTLADAAAFASETIASIRTVQAFNGEPQANRRYSGAVEGAYQAARSAVGARAVLTGVAISLVFGSVVAILWFGARNVLEGTMSAGTLGQFVLYSVIAASGLGQLSEVWGELAQAGGAAERLNELLHEKSPVSDPLEPKLLPSPASGALAFDTISFAYPAYPDRQVLSGLSFSARPGETVAIVGPSGAGKSTLFSLILRYYDPTSGAIRIDGEDIRETSLADLRARVAIVPQDVTIFATTIHDNIAFGRPDATPDMIRAAAKAAQADEFIQKLANGYDTLAGERGVTLSGGQRQRIAIARAILRDAPLLLLDEATSALDAESETLVQQALEELMKNRTTLVIAHRLATVLKADRILVMENGRVVEEGTHESLVQVGGLYARLARLQFEAANE
ncbi:MAG: ATP-binding cassette domain-containing protein [Proteobacteria bacterium]|nr:ATP-binding cassette domain-containing protein [Pseudomonadota bacterium]